MRHRRKPDRSCCKQTNSARYVRNEFVWAQASHASDPAGTIAPIPAASHNPRKMAYAEPHENLCRHMENIAAAVEGEREAMEVAEAESRRATRQWRKFSLWFANDSKTRRLPTGNHGRRFVKAKLVWWASKKSADSWRDIDRVIAGSGHIRRPVADQTSAELRAQCQGRGRTPGGNLCVDLT